MEKVGKNLVVFDFDWSLADNDSDFWAVGLLDNEFKKAIMLPFDKEWYLAMDDLFKQLHAKGFTKQDLINNLKTFPIHPKVIELIKKSKDLGNDFVIISDGNEFFINQILSNYNIRDYISQLLTNRISENQDGSLNLVPFRDPSKEAHNCKHLLNSGKNLCNQNLCKGSELKKLMEQNQYNKVIYTGDGQNDFCPMLQLRSQDIMCIRQNRRLEKLYQLEKDKFEIQAQVEFWSTGDELFNIFENQIFNV